MTCFELGAAYIEQQLVGLTTDSATRLSSVPPAMQFYDANDDMVVDGFGTKASMCTGSNNRLRLLITTIDADFFATRLGPSFRPAETTGVERRENGADSCPMVARLVLTRAPWMFFFRAPDAIVGTRLVFREDSQPAANRQLTTTANTALTVNASGFS